MRVTKFDERIRKFNRKNRCEPMIARGEVHTQIPTKPFFRCIIIGWFISKLCEICQ